MTDIPSIIIVVGFLLLFYVPTIFKTLSRFWVKAIKKQPTLNRTSLNPPHHERKIIYDPTNQDSQERPFEDVWKIDPPLQESLYDEWTKVWVMGRFKVGKSTLLQSLGIRDAQASNIENTVGEVFLKDESKKTLYVDSEGFEQTINIDDPELRMTLIITHARKCADVIIIVVPMMTISDQKLILKSITSLKTGQCRILIVHNLMHLESVEKIQSYKKRVEDFFDLIGPSNGIRTVRKDIYTITSYCENAVSHYYLGDIKQLSSYNKNVISCLRNGIEYAGRFRTVSLKESIKDTLLATYFWGYNIVGQCEVDDSTPNEFKISGKMTGKREIKLGGEILSGCGLEYTWQTPYVENGYYYQNLLVNTVRVDEASMKLVFEDSFTLKIHYTSVRVTDHEKLARLENQVETIFCSHAMVADKNATEFVNKGKLPMTTKEMLFKVSLNPSTELNVYFNTTKDKQNNSNSPTKN